MGDHPAGYLHVRCTGPAGDPRSPLQGYQLPPALDDGPQAGCLLQERIPSAEGHLVPGIQLREALPGKRLSGSPPVPLPDALQQAVGPARTQRERPFLHALPLRQDRQGECRAPAGRGQRLHQHLHLIRHGQRAQAHRRRPDAEPEPIPPSWQGHLHGYGHRAASGQGDP